MRKIFAAALLTLSALTSHIASAAPQCVAQPSNFADRIGHGLFASGAAQVSATFCGGEAGYLNKVFFYGNGEGEKPIGSGTTASGNSVDLSVTKAGDQLIFTILVREYDGTERRYRTGEVSPLDNVAHASVVSIGNGQYWIGFEDIFAGGDKDYNDAQIVVEIRTVDLICDCNADWPNHGQYMACVTRVVNDLVKQNALHPTEKGGIISQAAQSQCGKK